MTNKVSSKLAPFQKLLGVMSSGNAMTTEEIGAALPSLYMYRISTYMWLMKSHANAIIKVTKNGRKVLSYKLVNVDELKDYMRRHGIKMGVQPYNSVVTKKSSIPIAGNFKAAEPLADVQEFKVSA